MATKGTDPLGVAALQTLSGSTVHGRASRVDLSAGPRSKPLASADPSVPLGQTPPCAKTTAKGGAKPHGAKPGHPGRHRPQPTRIDCREEPTLSACPKCHGPVKPCRGSRTRIVEDIPTDIAPAVTEHTIHRFWCPHCETTVEPAVPDALPGSTIDLRVVVLSAWLQHLLGTTLAQIIDVFYFHLLFKLSSGGLIRMWRRLREILRAWYLEIQTQALGCAVLHADETGWRVNGKIQWLWCCPSKDVTYNMIDRRPGSPALKRFLKSEFTGVLVTDIWGA
jgi:transposase